MTAPALIALAHGSRDPRSAATINALTELVACMRPDLRVAPAFLDLSEPRFDATVDRLVAEGHQEIVVVPLPKNILKKKNLNFKKINKKKKKYK